MRTYIIGDRIRIVVNIFIEGAKTDPTELYFYVRTSKKDLLTYKFGVGIFITKQEVGSYYVDYEPDEPGRYFYRWEAKGDVQGSQESGFEIRKSMVL